MLNQNHIAKFFCVWLVCPFLISSLLLPAQEHTHRGYYFSVGGGYADGAIIVRNSEKWKLTGPAFGMHVFLGGSLKENLYLHFSFEAKVMHPKVNETQNDAYYTVEEVLRGAGITYYTKRNFFLSTSIGLGKFFITNKTTGNRYDTNNGFAFRIMGGKEWWISPKFALGLACEYGFTNLQYSRDHSKWSTQRFGVRATFSISRPCYLKKSSSIVCR